MDTQPIFAFLEELETRSAYVPPVIEDRDDERVRTSKAVDAYISYLVKLKGMKGKLETCVAQLLLENPSIKPQLDSVADRLKRIIGQYRTRRDDSLLSESFPDDQRAALLMAEETMKSLGWDKGATPLTNQDEVEVEQDSAAPLSDKNEKEIITGIRGLAKVLGVGVNKANAIVQSGILEKEHIQWNEGYWKFDKEKLLQFKKDNPNAFAKIKCTR